jgi:hypothetical protein
LPQLAEAATAVAASAKPDARTHFVAFLLALGIGYAQV